MYYYRYYTGGADVSASNPLGYSDLFVIQGIGGAAPDYISFISSDLLTGDIAADAATFGIGAITGATPVALGTLSEDQGWVLGMDTGVDQYYIASPEPASLATLAVGLLGFGFARRKRG